MQLCIKKYGPLQLRTIERGSLQPSRTETGTSQLSAYCVLVLKVHLAPPQPAADFFAFELRLDKIRALKRCAGEIRVSQVGSS